jgi:hypothetical protein
VYIVTPAGRLGSVPRSSRRSNIGVAACTAPPASTIALIPVFAARTMGNRFSAERIVAMARN